MPRKIAPKPPQWRVIYRGPDIGGVTFINAATEAEARTIFTKQRPTLTIVSVTRER